MLGVRVPAATLRMVDKLAAALSTDRSNAVRCLIDEGLKSGFAHLLLRSGRGRRAADRISGIIAANIIASAAEDAVQRAAPASSVAAEIKALRAREHATELEEAEADRLALARAPRTKA
jgi:hypothetical protein